MRAHRRVLPTYTFNRHRWLTLLSRSAGAARRSDLGSTWAVPNQCRELGWTRDATTLEGAWGHGEELTDAGRLQLALWDQGYGKVSV